MSDATLAIANLAEKLRAIAPVRIGRPALETTSATYLPVITIWSVSDSVAADQGYGSAMLYTRSIILEVTVTANNLYHETLDEVLAAIRAAIAQKVGQQVLGGYATALRQSDVRFFAPETNGSAALLQLTIEFDYLERF